MFICEPGDVAIVPFPFTDIAVAKPRPALALSSRTANEESGNTIFAMITTAAQGHWPQDVTLSHYQAAGVSAASIVRVKLFTLDNRLIARRVGRLASQDRTAVRRMLANVMAI